MELQRLPQQSGAAHHATKCDFELDSDFDEPPMQSASRQLALPSPCSVLPSHPPRACIALFLSYEKKTGKA